MKKIDWKDVAERAGKTFVQTAVSYLVAALTGVNFFDGDKSETFWVGLFVSAGAAGLSAVWNAVLSPIFGPKSLPPLDDGVTVMQEEEKSEG